MTHGPVGDSASGVDYEETEHSGKVVRIASVAALGGLLFGYDSAVINGAVKAVESHFDVGTVCDWGSRSPSALIGAALGAVVAGRIADRIGRISVMKIAAVLFLICAFGTGLASDIWIFVTLPGGRWLRRRHGVGDRTRLHRGDLAAAHPRPAGFAAAAGDRDGHLRVAGDRLPAGTPRGRIARCTMAGHGGMAMDVHRDGTARHSSTARSRSPFPSRRAILVSRHFDPGGARGPQHTAWGEEPRNERSHAFRSP